MGKKTAYSADRNKIWRFGKLASVGLAIVILMILTFVSGWYAGRNTANRQAYAALWESIETLSDPEECALCAEKLRHHAPCLIDLATGEIAELTVYQSTPTCSWELLPIECQPSGTFNYQPCAGLLAVRDTTDRICTVYLPEEYELMNPAHFCRDCRVLLAGAGLEGYAVLDLYDLNHVQAYSICRGESTIIRDYRISKERGQGGTWKLCVEGLL